MADRGQMPIRLKRRPDLQAAVADWHKGRFLTALIDGPLFALVQLSRYRDGDPRNRLGHPVLLLEAGQRVRLPLLRDGALFQCDYALAGLVYHIGDSLLAGHYRAALVYRPSVNAAPAFLVTDDGRKPARSKASDQAISTGCYLLLLVRTGSASRDMS